MGVRPSSHSTLVERRGRGDRQVNRSTLARRYAPLAAALAVQLVIIVTAPSTAQKGTTVASGASAGGFSSGAFGEQGSAVEGGGVAGGAGGVGGAAGGAGGGGGGARGGRS